MMTKSTFRNLILIGVSAALLLGAGCAQKIVNDRDNSTVTVSISAKGMMPGGVSAVESFWIAVFGEDIGQEEVRMAKIGNLIMGEITVRAGRARRFVAEARDRTGTALYRGETTRDVAPGSVLTLDITLLPVVPMFNFTPHYQIHEMGRKFSINVNAFGIQNLNEAIFDIYFPTVDSIITLDSVVKGTDLDATSYVSYEHGDYYPQAWMQVYQSNQMGILVDVSGNAHLATLYFSSVSDPNMFFDTANFRIELNYEIWRVVGDVRDTIPRDSIYTDGAIVELYRNPFVPTWERTIGGSSDDIAYSACRAHDGGIVVAGETSSFGAGLSDAYLVKVDQLGNVEWEQTFGGTAYDFGYSVKPTRDGGYIITGASASFDGDDNLHTYLIKTDGSGNLVWQKTYSLISTGRSVIQAQDGGYLITGTNFQAMGSLAFILKTNNLGDSIWARTYDLNTADYNLGESIVDIGNGYIITGGTESFDLMEDILLIITDDMGGVVDQVTHDGGAEDHAMQITPLTGGGYIVAGFTNSSGAGLYDILAAKVDISVRFSWTKTYGFPGNDFGYGVAATRDGGFILAGCAQKELNQPYDFYMVKAGANGITNWYKTYGGLGNEVGHAILPAIDGGYYIVGYTDSFGAGGKDIYIIKTDMNGNVNLPIFI